MHPEEAANDPTSATTKDLPLTDIATLPPVFELPFSRRNSARFDPHNNTLDSNGPSPASSKLQTSQKDPYESLELSDLGDDDLEAETDKMDFLDDDNNLATDKPSDLQELLKLTELARLKEVDLDDDSDDDFTRFQTLPDTTENGDETYYEDARENAADVSASTGAGGDVSGKEAVSGAIFDEEMRKRPLENGPGSTKKRMRMTTNSSNEAEEEEDVSAELSGSESAPNGVSEPNKAPPENVSSQKPEPTLKVDQDEAEDVDPEDEDDVENDDDKEDHSKNDQDPLNEKEDEDEEEPEDEDEDEDEDEERHPDIPSDVDLDEQRKLAVDQLISIEAAFAELRDKLYQDKLKLLEHELQLCLDGSHPELLKIYFKVNEFYQDNIKLANSNLSYNLKCINTETVATRTSIHQDFLKQLMDTKNDMISDTTSQWYKINKERNQLDQLVPDYNYGALPQIPNVTVAVPHEDQILLSGLTAETYGAYANGLAPPVPPEPLTKKAIKQNTLVGLVQQRNNCNHQVGILNGLLEFHGFPSAAGFEGENDKVSVQELLMRRATDEEIKDDLVAMGLSI